MSTCACALYCSHPLPVFSYKFRQASDFWYLTGFEEPDSAVILEKDSSPKGYRMTLFSLGRDFNKEKWEGARTSPDDAIRYFKADDAQSIAIFPTLLKAIASVYSNIYIDIPVSASISRRRSLSKALLRVRPHGVIAGTCLML